MATRYLTGRFYSVVQSPGCVYLTFKGDPESGQEFKDFFEKLGTFVYEPKTKFCLLADLSQLGRDSVTLDNAKVVAAWIKRHRPMSKEHLVKSAIVIDGFARPLVTLAFKMGDHSRPFQVCETLQEASKYLGWTKE